MNPITKYLATIGRKGGAVKSAAKAAAAKANGKKGGRPRKAKQNFSGFLTTTENVEMDIVTTAPPKPGAIVKIGRKKYVAV